MYDQPQKPVPNRFRPKFSETKTTHALGDLTKKIDLTCFGRMLGRGP